MGVDEGNLRVMDVEWCILTSSSYGVKKYVKMRNSFFFKFIFFTCIGTPIFAGTFNMMTTSYQ